jgi:hypothetical protein
MFRYPLILALGLLVASSANAATWADALFDELSKDFGSVPRGPALTHSFRIVNKTQNVITITNVRVSCGCTTAHALKTTLNPGEETAIQTRMDTTRFSGPRTFTVFVQFGPIFDEVRLWLMANSRSDINLTPESLSFGQVKRGSTPSMSLRLTFYGNPEAQITEARPESNYVLPSIKEISRQPVEVVYELTVQLRSDTPVGRWFTDVWLKTNLPGVPQVRVPLTVEIESLLTVSPSLVSLGEVKVGSTTQRRIVVRGAKPFRITSIQGMSEDLEVKFQAGISQEIHILTVIAHPRKAGPFNRQVGVITDLPQDNQIEFNVQATITP